jgi:hypothetical protein
MSGTNNTNVIVHGSGTAADPTVYDFHVTAQSVAHGERYFLVLGRTMRGNMSWLPSIQAVEKKTNLVPNP